MSEGWIIAIIDIVFVLFLGIGFWAGAARGVKRSALDLGIMIAGVIIVGFITPPITNAILKINVTVNGTSSSLETFFVQALTNDPNSAITKLVNSSPAVNTLLQKLPSVLLCAIIFLILNLVMRLVAYLIYKIIAVCAFKTKKKEKEKGLKRNRWLGGIIGTFKMFALILVIFMPLTSVVKLADRIVPESTASASSSQEDPLSKALGSIPKQVKLATSSVNKSAFGVLNGAVGLDDFIFDNISQFDYKGNKVQIRKEISLYLDLYYDIYDITTSTSGIENVDWNEMDKLYKRATSGGFYKTILLNAVGEMIDNYPTLIEIEPSLDQFELVFADIKAGLERENDYAKYIGSDIDKAYGIFSQLGKSGYLKEAISNKDSAVDAIVLLTTKYNPTLTSSVSSLFDMNLVRDAFSSTLDFALTQIAGEGSDIFKDANTTITDWDDFKSQVTGVLNKLGEIDETIKAEVPLSHILSDFKKALLIDKDKIDDVLTKVGGILDDVDNMAIMKDKQGDKILPQLLEKFGVGNLLSVQKETIENYSQLFKFISTPVKNLISLNLYDAVENGADMDKMIKTFATRLKEEKKENEYSKLMEDTILPLYKVDVLRDVVFSKIADLKNDIVDFSYLERNKTSDEDEGTELSFDEKYANWQNDLPLLTQVITELESRYFDEQKGQTMLDYLLSGGDINELVKKLDDDAVEKIITPILNAKCMQPLKNQLAQKISEAMDDIVGKDTVTLEIKNAMFEGEESQTAEFVEIFKKFVNILKNTDLNNVDLKTIDPQLLGDLMEALKANAYRTELSEKKVEGATKGMFEAIMQKAESEFNVDMKKLLKKSSYADINFMDIFKLAQLANEANEFAEQFKDVVFNPDNKELKEQDYTDLIDKVTQDETVVEELLDAASGLDIDLNIDESTKSKIEEHLDQTQINDELKQKLKDFLGIGVN